MECLLCCAVAFQHVEQYNIECNMYNNVWWRLCWCCSDYKRNLSTPHPYQDSAVAGSGVHSALWKLFLALIFKAIITIFTFGIKVRPVSGISVSIVAVAGGGWNGEGGGAAEAIAEVETRISYLKIRSCFVWVFLFVFLLLFALTFKDLNCVQVI